MAGRGFKLAAPWGAVYIYGKDHLPPHVHGFYETEEIIVNLNTLTLRRKPPYLNDDEIDRVLAFVTEHQQLLLSEWTKIHG